MNRIVMNIMFVSLLTVFVFSAPAYAKVTINEQMDILIHQGIEKVQHEQIEGALADFQQIILMDPKSPVGYFYIAALYEVLMQNYRTRAFSEKFYYYVGKAIALGEESVKRDGNDEWANFYLGGAYGYRAIDRSENGNWFGAFLDAQNGAEYLQAAININPMLYDAYFGFGVYKYWRSVKSKVLWFLPFFEDERAAGIRDIQTAITMGKYTRIAGKRALIGIYYNEKEYDSALQLIGEILSEYPEDVHAVKMKGVIFYDQKRWDEAVLVFSRLSDQLRNSRWKNSGIDMEVEYYLTLANYKLERMHEYQAGRERLSRMRKVFAHKTKSGAVKELLDKVSYTIDTDTDS
jgi:tetratricopeptide (TPR) repeat protein